MLREERFISPLTLVISALLILPIILYGILIYTKFKLSIDIDSSKFLSRKGEERNFSIKLNNRSLLPISKIDIKYEVVEKPQAAPISVMDISVVKRSFSHSASFTELTKLENDILSPFLKSLDKCEVLTLSALAQAV